MTFKVRGCLMNVYNKLGPGYREETYKRALIKEFTKNNIPFVSEETITIKYDNEAIDEYKADLITFGKIIIELKAVAEMHPVFEAQLLSYLKAADMKLRLLVNFGSNKLFIKRFVNPHYKQND